MRQLRIELGPQNVVSRAPDAGAVHRRRRRAQDQADAALGAEAARDRHPARRAHLPLRPPARAPTSRRRSRSSPTSPPTPSSPSQDVPTDLRGAAPPPRRGARRQDLRAAQHLVARARARRAGSASSSKVKQPAVARWRSASSASTSSWSSRYKSLNEALIHGGIANDCRVDIRHIDSEEIERDGAETLLRGRRRHPGRARLRRARHRGQDRRRSATRARSRCRSSASASACRSPSIEFARNVCGLAGANSTEFDPATPHPVVDADARAARRQRQGRHHAPRRLSLRARRGHQGAPRPTARSRSASATATATRSTTTSASRSSSRAWCCRACRRTSKLVEMIELPDHPYFVGCQFHPEFKSRPMSPHPLFRAFVHGMLEHQTVARRDRAEATRVPSPRADRSKLSIGNHRAQGLRQRWRQATDDAACARIVPTKSFDLYTSAGPCYVYTND